MKTRSLVLPMAQYRWGKLPDAIVGTSPLHETARAHWMSPHCNTSTLLLLVSYKASTGLITPLQDPAGPRPSLQVGTFGHYTPPVVTTPLTSPRSIVL